MPEIKIKIRDKRAGGTGTVICGNSDYTVVWDLDDEWTPYGTKTMRVNLADGTYQDVVFSGDTAALPVLSTPGWASVGLYAGDLHTSRAADLWVLPSVTTPGGAPADPAEDVYDQLTEKLNRLIAVQPESRRRSVKRQDGWGIRSPRVIASSRTGRSTTANVFLINTIAATTSTSV